MSKEKRIITIIAFLFLVFGFVSLYWIVQQTKEKEYISSIAYTVDDIEFTDSNDLFYYWSTDKKVEESKFVQYKFDNEKIVVLRFSEENEVAQSIYLHLRTNNSEGNKDKIVEFKNYINKPVEVLFNQDKAFNIGDSMMKINLASNRYSKIKTLYVQISDNVITTKTPIHQLQYRYLEVLDGKKSHKYDLRLDFNSYNIQDGNYYLKLSVIDTAGKITEVYSEAIQIDFGIISKRIQFNAPIVDENGQLIKQSEYTLTGNTLVEFDGTQFDKNTPMLSQAYLTLNKSVDDDNKLNVRLITGDVVNSIQLVKMDDTNQYQVESYITNHNDWYYLYYEDEFIGVFLHQVNR